MTIVVANRNGIAQGPDGAKYRLAAGRTLADARHPLAQAHPELFSPYSIELAYEGDEAADGGNLEFGEAHSEMIGELVDARAAADGYRAQLAAIAEGLHSRGLVPAELDTEREGWLAELVFAIIDAPPAAPEQAAELPKAVTGEPAALPKATRRRARPASTDA